MHDHAYSRHKVCVANLENRGPGLNNGEVRRPRKRIDEIRQQANGAELDLNVS